MTDLLFVSPPRMTDVLQLLKGAGLPYQDIDASLLAHFFALTRHGETVGIAGVEPHGPDGLLRSLVVRDTSRGSGLGRDLVAEAERRAAESGIETLYLLTDTAAGYFRRFGYQDWPRVAAPPAIRHTREFSALCPDDAAFMRKRL